MRRVATTTVSALLLLATASVANELAATKFYNLVDTPATIIFNSSGVSQVAFEPPGGLIIDVAGYRKVNFEIGKTKATTFTFNIGKISAGTLAESFSGPIDAKIHTYNVVGPEMSLFLKGAPKNAHDTVQIWLFLSS